jgi:photosystem II stability/assembly factor-like uncharacterized protein
MVGKRFLGLPGSIAGLCCLVLLSGGCKKDLLHLHKVQRLNSTTNIRLNQIFPFGNNTYVICGGRQFWESEMLRSTDGYNWTSDSSTDAPKEMYGGSVSPNGQLFICGIDGDVLHSVDTGKTWHFNRIGNWEVYFGGGFPTPDTGFFVSSILQRGGSIVRVDGNFNIIDEQQFQFGMNNVYMVNRDTGYVIGYGAVMKTTNGGNTWNFLSAANDNFTAMDIHGSEIWLCGAAGSVFHTTDGGNNWARLRNGNDFTLPSYNLRCILFKDELNGWAAGDNGKLIRTDDGGHHWSEYDQFTTSAIRSIVFCDNGDLLLAGDDGILFRVTPD